ncbi:MAG: polysaccharide biosynthesis tyrosine autokinase [Actinomycetes bacterium]
MTQPGGSPSQPSTLELRDYLRVLRRRKWTIAVTTLVCVAVAGAMAFTRKPIYAASSNVLVQQRLVDNLFVPIAQQGGGAAANGGLDKNRANEIQIVTSPAVTSEVQKTLAQVPADTTFNPVTGTDVITITSTGGSPKLVADTANAYATTYAKVRTDLVTGQLQQAATELQKRIDETTFQLGLLDGDLAANPPAVIPINNKGATITAPDTRTTKRAQLQANADSYNTQLQKMLVGVSVAQTGGTQILSKAQTPVTPTNGSPMRNVAAGLAVGLILGIALAFLREYVDDSVKTKEDLESATGLTAVGLIPVLTDWKKREAATLISSLAPRSPAAEAYRNIRTSVEFLSLDQPIGSIQVTSALASEGKTTTLANLAVTFARAGQRVIILCCDLRRPRVHEFYGLSNRVGFTSVLLGDAPLGAAIQQADRELPIGLVASGPLPPNPAELLASRRAVEVIEDLDNRCDLLLIDSPPVLPVTDALVISGLVDAVLVVANSGTSTKRGLRRTTELLRQVDAPLIGAILNGVQSKHEYGYVYGDNRYYLDSNSAEKKKSTSGRNGRARSRAAAR